MAVVGRLVRVSTPGTWRPYRETVSSVGKGCKPGPGLIQGSYRPHTRLIHTLYKAHTKAHTRAHTRLIQGSYKVHTRLIHGSYKVHTRLIQGHGPPRYPDEEVQSERSEQIVPFI